MIEKKEKVVHAFKKTIFLIVVNILFLFNIEVIFIKISMKKWEYKSEYIYIFYSKY